MVTYRGQRNGRSGEATALIFEGNRLVGPLDPRNDLRNHSPDGFQWGYSGSGPAQLALALCADVMRRTLALGVEPEYQHVTRKWADAVALAVYQDVKFQLVGPIRGDTWEYSLTTVLGLIVAVYLRVVNLSVLPDPDVARQLFAAAMPEPLDLMDENTWAARPQVSLILGEPITPAQLAEIIRRWQEDHPADRPADWKSTAILEQEDVASDETTVDPDGDGDEDEDAVDDWAENSLTARDLGIDMRMDRD